MGLTLLLTFFAITGGLLPGTLLALARLAPIRPLSFVAGTDVNFFRSMPLILVIFWFYFLLPLVVHAHQVRAAGNPDPLGAAEAGQGFRRHRRISL